MKKRLFIFYDFIFYFYAIFCFILSMFYVWLFLRYRLYCKNYFYCKKNVTKFQKITFLNSKKSHAFLHGRVSQKNPFCHAFFAMQKSSKGRKKILFDQHPIQKPYSLIYSKIFRVSKVTRYTANRFFYRYGGSFLTFFTHVLKSR